MQGHRASGWHRAWEEQLRNRQRSGDNTGWQGMEDSSVVVGALAPPFSLPGMTLGDLGHLLSLLPVSAEPSAALRGGGRRPRTCGVSQGSETPPIPSSGWALARTWSLTL